MWLLSEDTCQPEHQHQKETIFTVANGHLSTRGSFEGGHPVDRRATFIHGDFDAIPIAFTELANAPGWPPLLTYQEGEQFSLESGALQSYPRMVDLKTGLLRRMVATWEIHACPLAHWKRSTFHFVQHGEIQVIDLQNL